MLFESQSTSGPGTARTARGLTPGGNVLMQSKSSPRPKIDDIGIAQRGIVLQVVRDDHRQRWTREQLERTLFDVEPAVIADSLERLEEAGVVHRIDDVFGASRCARHLDSLGMICA